jgi:hypothetical protein
LSDRAAVYSLRDLAFVPDGLGELPRAAPAEFVKIQRAAGCDDAEPLRCIKNVAARCWPSERIKRQGAANGARPVKLSAGRQCLQRRGRIV